MRNVGDGVLRLNMGSSAQAYLIGSKARARLEQTKSLATSLCNVKKFMYSIVLSVFDNVWQFEIHANPGTTITSTPLRT